MWGILELMGHTRLAGFITEEEKFGGKIGRIDIPLKDGSTVTQYFGGASVFRLTATSEEVARSVALSLIQPVPVSSWELPKQLEPSLTERLEKLAGIDDYGHDHPGDDQ